MLNHKQIDLWKMVAVAALLLGGVSAGAQNPVQAGDESVAGEPKASVPEAGHLATADEAGEEDGYEWFFDMESDRRYRVEKVRRVEKAYRWEGEGQKQVRLVLGLVYDVVRYDDDWFWVKVWEPGPPLEPKPRRNQEPTEEELAAVAAKYVTHLEEVDRVVLEPFDQGLPRRGQWRNGFDLADMNEDGHIDIVFGPARKGTPRPNFFLGDGKGVWRPWPGLRFPRLPYDYGDAAAADFNGDGHMDIAMGVHLRGLIALVGDGEGGFEPWMEGIPIEMPGKGGDASSFSSRSIEAVDWDGDGRIDILALGEGPKGQSLNQGERSRPLIDTARGFALFRNNGDGTWAPQRLEAEPFDFGDSFAMADLTGDGEKDLLVATRIKNNRWVIRTGEPGKMENREIDTFRTGAWLTSVTTADFDGDGRAEIVAAYMNKELGQWRSGIDVFFAREDAAWERRPLLVVEQKTWIRSVAVGDLDGDERLDIVSSMGHGQIHAFLGDGKGGFANEAMPEGGRLEENCGGWHIELEDVDLDGRDELFVSFAGELTGLPGMEGLYEEGCTRGGAIKVWSPTPVAEASSPPKASS